MATSLATPDKIRTLQRKLYLKAKAEPGYRFYLLYDKIHREDILIHAYALTRSNGGASGVDGVTFATIEAAGLENWLSGIETELRTKRYLSAGWRHWPRRQSTIVRAHQHRAVAKKSYRQRSYRQEDRVTRFACISSGQGTTL